MITRARILSLALLAGVVAGSSALAGSNDSSFPVTSSLDGKTVLPVRSHWIADPKLDPAQGQVTEVDYLIDGYHAWSAHNAPSSRACTPSPSAPSPVTTSSRSTSSRRA